jgi:formylglycine-generating enzyme required for sulfatase activity
MYVLSKGIKRHRVPLAFAASLLGVAFIFGLLPGGWLRPKVPNVVAMAPSFPGPVTLPTTTASASVPIATTPPLPAATQPTNPTATTKPAVSSASLAQANRAQTPDERTPDEASNTNPPAPVATAPVVSSPPISMAPPPDAKASGNSKPSKIGDSWANSLGMTFAYIPAGTFVMGSPADEAGHGNDETQHKVTLTKSLLMGTTHVTKGQFAAFVRDSGHQTDAEKERWATAFDGKRFSKVNGASWRNPGFDQGDDHPVVCVSWNDATAFCDWLSRKEGKHYRLPTEAEWEHAARAGTQTAYPWGNNPDDGNGWGNCADQSLRPKFPDWSVFNWDDGYMFTSPVGRFRPNAWGLYEMIGNACEWCGDWYANYPVGDATDPHGPDNGTLRVLRGASWLSHPIYGRCAGRYSNAPVDRYDIIGFRVVLDPDSVPPGESWAPLPAPPEGARRQVTNSVGMTLVEIKPGSFLMGSPADEPFRKPSEIQHKVTLTKPFYLATTTVTQAQWEAVMGNNPSHFQGDGLPVETVSYDDALAFCRKLSQTEGKQYRLPTEAEWEYSCRAGTTTAYFTGDGIQSAEKAGWDSRNSDGRTHPVGGKIPNAWGLFDMIGNVWQWCEDAYRPYPKHDETDPAPRPGTARIVRGGSFEAAGGPTRCRSASRGWFEHGYRSRDVGFRVVLDADSVPPGDSR